MASAAAVPASTRSTRQSIDRNAAVEVGKADIDVDKNAATNGGTRPTRNGWSVQSQKAASHAPLKESSWLTQRDEGVGGGGKSPRQSRPGAERDGSRSTIARLFNACDPCAVISAARQDSQGKGVGENATGGTGNSLAREAGGVVGDDEAQLTGGTGSARVGDETGKRAGERLGTEDAGAVGMTWGDGAEMRSMGKRTFGSRAGRLAEWVKQGSVDDSDAETTSSRLSPSTCPAISPALALSPLAQNTTVIGVCIGIHPANTRGQTGKVVPEATLYTDQRRPRSAPSARGGVKAALGLVPPAEKVQTFEAAQAEAKAAANSVVQSLSEAARKKLEGLALDGGDGNGSEGTQGTYSALSGGLAGSKSVDDVTSAADSRDASIPAPLRHSTEDSMVRPTSVTLLGWRGETALLPPILRPRRSLSVGAGRSIATQPALTKTGRAGWVSEGEGGGEGEGEELSPTGHEIAYMKQGRGSGSAKADKQTGGLSLGAWPNKVKKDADSAKVIYLGDIDFDAPGKATATDILVRQHRTRVRVKRVKNKASQKKRKPKHSKAPTRRIRSGKPLHPEEDEVEYILTIGMMLGLRVAVGRQASPLAKPELTVEDFYQVDKYTFPPSGATGYLVTPSHKLGQTFKFKDYAPKVFKKIREHFGVDKMRYMLSVAGNYNFLEFISNAKSGEFFFFSHDERFMIKTMKSSETKFLRRILPHYYEHVKVHPETFLVRFYGMYRVKMHHINRKVHFIVMNSVLDTYKEIHSTYDLKGSSLGRSAKSGEKVLKDNDLASRQGKLHLGSQREAFLKVARADSEFLARMKIMDYSLLTGIHDRSVPAEEEIRQSPRRYSKFFTFADEAENKTTPGFKQVPAIPVHGAAGGGSAAEGGKAAAGKGTRAGQGKHDADGRRGGVGWGSVEREPAPKPTTEEPRTPQPRAESASPCRTLDSAQAELMFDGTTGNDTRKRKQLSAALESVAAAVATGKLYPPSNLSNVSNEGEEGEGVCDSGDVADVFSDEEGAAGDIWSGGGTGTEGEGDGTEGEDTGGFTEGDAEDETNDESNIDSTTECREQTLSRRSTAQGTLARVAVEAGAARRGRHKRPSMRNRPRPMPCLAPPESGDSCVIRRRADGGLESEVDGKRGKDIYFMGIIDILQEYNARKHGETFFKSLAHDRAEISCVDPQMYCQRFNDFLERHTD